MLEAWDRGEFNGNKAAAGRARAGSDPARPLGLGRPRGPDVRAERVGLDAHARAADRLDLPIRDHAECALCDRGDVVQHRSRLRARHERAVGAIRAIDEGLARHPEPCTLARAHARAHTVQPASPKRQPSTPLAALVCTGRSST